MKKVEWIRSAFFIVFFLQKMSNYTKHIENGTKPVGKGTKPAE
jgi:hypothetical protein